jgi:hypothetical protein
MSAIAFPTLNPDKNDAVAQLLQKMLQASAVALGDYGSIRVNDTVTHGGVFRCIIPNTDCVFSALVGNITGGTGVTWTAGVPIYGIFTTFTLTSGEVTAYKGQ